jgi:predicted alpha/beta hydrolase family esterase
MNINFNNFIILHGSFGSKDGNWFPWLKEMLEGYKYEVDVPQMPVGVGNQNFDNWSKEFDKLKIDEKTVIIAHSIAPIFVCKYLISKKIKVRKLVFVCGFNNYLGIDPDFDAVNESMFTDDLPEIKDYCPEIICYYSDNDPYVKFDVEKDFADAIATRQHIIKDGGHINAESGYTEFEEILKELI